MQGGEIMLKLIFKISKQTKYVSCMKLISIDMIDNEVKNMESSSQDDLKLTDKSLHYLDTTRKWAMFLAIIGLIGIAILILLSIFMTVLVSSRAFSAAPSQFSMIPLGMISFVYLICAILYFFPVYYLLRFSMSMKKSLLYRNELTLEEALRYLKNHYQITGIITAGFIILYFIIVVGMVILRLVSAI